MSGPTVGQVGERDLVRGILKTLGSGADERVIVGAGDDAAVVKAAGDVVLTVDTQREGSHFERGWLSAADLGRRALAVSVSDLAAMGAQPLCALCSLLLPGEVEVAWLKGMVEGMRAGGEEFGCRVIGGDVARGQPLALCVTAVGEMPAGRRPVLRSGAAAGDDLVVAGLLGHAAAGRIALARGLEQLCPQVVGAYRRPSPLTALALEIAPHCNAMMDISDGLAMDLTRLSEASGVGAVLEADDLVDDGLAVAARQLDVDGLDLALGGGDDYSLLIAVAPDALDPLARAAACHGVPLRRVGGVTAVPDLFLRSSGHGTRALAPAGWDPFTARAR